MSPQVMANMVEEDIFLLSEFVKLDRAIAYAEDYISSKLRISVYQEAIGGENSDFIRAFDASKEWIYVKRIK